jgi:uncharacterized protein YbaP (TraB family)
MLCAAALLGALGCAGGGPRDRAELPHANASAAAPLFWHALGPGGGAYYLLGSVHVRAAGAPTLGPEIEGAYARSHALVVEVDDSKLTPADVGYYKDRFAVLPTHLTLDALIEPGTRKRLARWTRSRELPPEQIQNLKPWFASLLIQQHEFRAAGYDAALGVDRSFIDQASGRKPIVALETIASQFEAFDGLPIELQERMLDDVLRRVDELPEHAQAVLEAWTRGDGPALEHHVYESLHEHPELEPYYEAIYWRRNAAMSERLVALAADGRTRFVVLGASHMVGAKGIPSLLAARGFRVARVPTGPDAALR